MAIGTGGEDLARERIAGDADRLPEGQRLLAHFMITEQYQKRQRALPSGVSPDDESEDESPFADISIGDGGAWEA
ncbi:hypothetical protein [Pseudofrankia asymbiotica]|uniref:Uncharacterized protein n=1 Tax=Pseudofrankia asymbiotica TaxID=1834516 RepID=A0A1V2I1D0_9ACTN|nr:hypothetical protein [Pseudofrankia asymbiotica]ONH23140.1 hypothetical protein BL253_33765 [Pseudofrankia asymbiotica]